MFFDNMDSKKSFYELVRFVIVGGAATLVDLAVTTALVFATSLHENIITSVAFITAFWVSYFGHKNFTFKKDGSAVAFFILAVSTLVIRNIIVWGLVLCNIRGLPALITAMVAVTAITYFVAKFKIFKG
ncbi:MAG: GtrA family protein [Succinivibrio sp.]|nr:GtrA family protein [Succinivibrio sp.]